MNKTKSTKHVSTPLFDKSNAAKEADENRKQSDSISKKPIKHYQLPNVPLYHAAHGQMMHQTNETVDDSIRSRSSIQKRASKADWLSRNISMVLEQLLMHYENSYLPTHGQGTGTIMSIFNQSISTFYFVSGIPTVVKTNILIRSMGPVSELDMVNLTV